MGNILHGGTPKIRTLQMVRSQLPNKIIKEATTKQFFETLKQHLMLFLLYYNYQRPLESLKLKTPWELIQKWYDEKPDLFK